MSARMPNHCLSAPPEVPVPGPSQDQDLSFPTRRNCRLSPRISGGRNGPGAFWITDSLFHSKG